MKLLDALKAGTAVGLSRPEAQWLLLHVLARPLHDRAWLLAHDHDTLTPAQSLQFSALLVRADQGEPLGYLVGTQAFFGLDLQVDGRVLLPRPDTETLVHWALNTLAGQTQPRVLDLGTGSGAVALAIQQQRPDAIVTATDASTDALTVARGNATRLGLPVQFLWGDWLAPVSGLFDLIVSNPPYIEDNDPHLAGLTHEPLSALTAGPDGLADLRCIVRDAPAHLRPGGWLLLEHGYNQSTAVQALLCEAGFQQVGSRTDLTGTLRCSGGQISPQAAPAVQQ
jgi:release factor glutamine methyltransferase